MDLKKNLKEFEIDHRKKKKKFNIQEKNSAKITQYTVVFVTTEYTQVYHND